MKLRDVLTKEQCKEIWEDLNSKSATKKNFHNLNLYTEIEVSTSRNVSGDESGVIQARFYNLVSKKSINYIKFLSISFEKPKLNYMFPAVFLNAINDLLNTELEVNLTEPGNLFKDYVIKKFYLNLMDFYTNEVFIGDIEKMIVSSIREKEAHVSKCLSDSTTKKILNIQDIKLTHYYNTNEEKLVITNKKGKEVLNKSFKGSENIAELFDQILRSASSYFETKVGPINYEDILK